VPVISNTFPTNLLQLCLEMLADIRLSVLKCTEQCWRHTIHSNCLSLVWKYFELACVSVYCTCRCLVWFELEAQGLCIVWRHTDTMTGRV